MLAEVSEAMVGLAARPDHRRRTSRLQGTILLAEDGLDNQQLISLHLRKAGAEVVIADNGRIAVDLDRRRRALRPDPHGHADARARRLRRRQRAPQTGYTLPIIALTAHAMAEDRSRCLAGRLHRLPHQAHRQADPPGHRLRPHDPRPRHQRLRRRHQHPLADRVPPRRGRRRAAPDPSPTPAPVTATTPATPDADSESPLKSAFGEDPDMREVIAEFVERLPGQVAKMLQLVEAHNLDELRRAVHQMKGAGGGYGFSPITQLAARAEQTVKEGGPLDAISQQVDNLIRLIRRVEGYDLRREDPTNATNV